MKRGVLELYNTYGTSMEELGVSIQSLKFDKIQGILFQLLRLNRLIFGIGAFYSQLRRWFYNLATIIGLENSLNMEL
jgi:hypothetical protein